jgi:hypothetical protein
VEISQADVLVFVEDPGAANYLAELPAALAAQGFRASLTACGPASEYLRQRGIPFEAPPYTLAGSAARLLIAGTAESPDAFGLHLISEARALGIPSAAAVDARMNADIRFRGHSDDPLACAPDWLLLVDEWTKDAFATLGFPGQHALVCGHPRFDRIRALAARFAGEDRRRARSCLFQQVPPSSPLILFAAEPLLRQNRPDGRGSNRPETALRWLLESVEDVAPNSCVAVRPHPKNRPGDFASLRDRFVLTDSGEDGMRMAWAADIVVGLTSTYLIEASLLGTPTLSIVTYPSERNWLPTVEAGITPCATGADQVRAHLIRLFQDGRAVASDALNQLVPPGALGRIAGFVGGILTGGH